MRLLSLILALLMALAGFGLHTWARAERQKQEQRIDQAQASLHRLLREVRYRAGSGQVEVNGRGWPNTIDPEWFFNNSRLPRNPLVSSLNPWVEVAPEWQYDMTDPPTRVALDESFASFWYNPANGHIRARVSQEVSDRRALELYNLVNSTNLDSLFLPVLEGEAMAEAPAD